MPRLDRVLIILEDNFHKVMECSVYHGSAELGRARGGLVLDGVEVEDAGNVEPIGELQRGRGIEVGDPVDGVSELAVDIGRRIGQNYSSRDWNGAIVE